ncbi:S1 family peptidase [Rhodopirellula sallentina]|uniref:Secreted protein n=1 Tax=Rhodopirellula sallentina SM41 TaxID=1263870 RepID=M5TYV3_9BACT|nr:serine protease [Rhodopirellula sallentina]EMI54380.1 secreted protein [Rhodopirellula sallentina SM41]
MRIFFATILVVASIGMIVMFIFLDAAPAASRQESPVNQGRAASSNESPAAKPSAPSNEKGADAVDLRDDTALSRSEASLNSLDASSVAPKASGSRTADEKGAAPVDEILATVRSASSLSVEMSAAGDADVDSNEDDLGFVREVTVEVHNLSGDAVGLGVVVAVGARVVDILTADHVLDAPVTGNGPLRLAVRWTPAESIEDDPLAKLASLSHPVYKAVRVLRRDSARDLAVLRVEIPGGTEAFETATLYPGGIDSLVSLVGETAWTTSVNDLDAGKVVTEIRPAKIQGMEVARVSEFADSNVYLRVDTPSRQGMSGGGLFRRSNGGKEPRLLGIASGNSMGHGYYVAANVIVDLMREIRASGL